MLFIRYIVLSLPLFFEFSFGRIREPSKTNSLTCATCDRRLPHCNSVITTCICDPLRVHP